MKIYTTVYRNELGELTMGEPVEENFSYDELSLIVDEYRIMTSELSNKRKNELLKKLQKVQYPIA